MSLSGKISDLAMAMSLAMKRQSKSWISWAPGSHSVLCPPGYRLEWMMCGAGGAGGAGGTSLGGGAGAGGSTIFGCLDANAIASLRSAWDISSYTPLNIVISGPTMPGQGQTWSYILLASAGPNIARIMSAASGSLASGGGAGSSVRAAIYGGNGGAGSAASGGNAGDIARAGAGAPGGVGAGRSATQWFAGGIGGQGFMDGWGALMGVANLSGGGTQGAPGLTIANAPAPWRASTTPITLGGGGGASSISGRGGNGGNGGPGCGGGGGGSGNPGGNGGNGGPAIVSIRLVREGNW